MMYQINANKRDFLKHQIIDGAEKYKKNLIGKVFYIICEDGMGYYVRFFKDDFIHLVGVCSDLSDKRFFDNSADGCLDKDNIKEFQKYNWATLKSKANGIVNIDKIIYGKSENSLFMVNLKTNTYTYPVAIRNKDINLCIGFKDHVNKARTLRKYNNSSDASEQKMIIAIFSTTSENKQCNEMVYLSDYDRLMKMDESIIKKINNELLSIIKPVGMDRKKRAPYIYRTLERKLPICFQKNVYSEKLKRIKLKNRMR